MIIDKNPWPFLILKHLIYLAVAVGIGAFFGLEQLAAIIVLSIILIILFSRMYILDRWLRTSRMTSPPEAPGIWGDILDQIHNLRQRDKKRAHNLSRIVKRFESSALALPDGVVGIDAEGEMEWWNETAALLLGLKRKQDKGQRIDNLIRNPEFVQFYRQTNHEKPIHIPSPVNNEIIMEIRVVDYGLKEQIIIVRDISDAIRTQQMRKDFVANVSHELRTPLTVLNGTTELLYDSAHALPEQMGKPIELMNQQTKRMTSIVNDLLTLSRLETESSEAHFEDIKMKGFIETLQKEAKALSGDSKHEIICEIDAELHFKGNLHEITSCFTNLVSNAIRHTPKNGKIIIRWYKKEGDKCFEVQDNGFGIAPEHIPRLTERFYRVDAGRSRDTGGTGLGLSIVKRILIRHNATLEIESIEGAGSTFRCRFKNQ
ncbi:MAG: phosphate regulon sensor histidine kinase PhoR [Gammaproteobacteria bacterium]|nr:MAG: phosphate regulon sensor histidine kinase PhoR [Gammaproteobacteria bacterium]